MDLYFTVEHQHIKRTDDNYVVAGSRNYLYANFTFTKEWNANIIAIFASKCGTYAQLLKDGRCLVTYEALKQDGRIDVSVCAGDLITSDTAGFIVHETGYTEDAEKSIAPPPTILSDIYERIEKTFINAKTEALQEVSEVLENYLKLTDVDSDLVYGSSNPVASGAVYNKFQSEIDRRMHLDYVKADKEHNGGFIGGAGASLGGAGGAAIGAKAKASSGMAGGSGASVSEGMACGKNAYASHLKQYYVTDNHEPIIDRKTFETAQRIMEEKEMAHPHIKAYDYKFKDMVFCGECGAKFARKKVHTGTVSEHFVWKCRTYTHKGKKYCDNKQIPDKTLIMLSEDVDKEIAKIIVHPNNAVCFQLADGSEVTREWKIDRKGSEDCKTNL